MRQACLIALLLPMAGCGELLGTSAELTMTPSVAPTVVRARDMVAVTFTLTNSSVSAVSFSDNVCPGLLEIVDAGGKVVYSVEDFVPLVDCFANFRTVTLGPGESFSWAEYWYGHVRSTTSEPAYVRPGRYRVRAWIGSRFQNVGRFAARSADLVVQ